MKEDPSYKIAESLFSSLKGFVVLGLCGRTGSGCSTTAEILGKNFSQLNLPTPSEELEGSIPSAEELILHNYARKNWTPFYQIKVSRLMTGYLLDETFELFATYLGNVFHNLPSKSMEKIKDAVKNFYDAKMEFVLPAYFTQRITADFPEDPSPDALTWKRILEGLGGFLTEEDSWDLLFSQERTEEKIKSQLDKEPPYRMPCKTECTYEYQYEEDKGCVFYVKLSDMQKLMEEYESTRKGKGTLRNPLLSWLLFEYAYRALPKYADELLEKIGEVQRGLPTMIMQDVGINLRTWGKPLVYDAEKQGCSFQKEGFLTIVKRVNLYLKILRDYLQRREEYREGIHSWLAENIKEKARKSESSRSSYLICLEELSKESKQVVVVIDSIKNPFESMYLKARYSSYYLTAIYTDEAERYARLQDSPRGLTLQEIQTIDTIEQLNKLKDFQKENEETNPNAGDEDAYDTNSMLSKAVLNQLMQKFKRGGVNVDEILPFITQNVEHCLESADIFINNHNDDNQYLSLKKKLIRYVSLIMNPGLVLPTDIERCMQIAQTAKVCSGCVSRQVGAVLTDSRYQIRSVGWNDVPSGRVPCVYRDMMEIKQHWNPKAYSEFENDDNDMFQKHIGRDERIEQACKTMQEQGKRIPYCFKDVYNAIMNTKNQVHPRSLHAEERAFLNLADQGGASIEGGYLFTTSSPCELCTKKACYMGISKVYYVQPYSGISFKHIMQDGPEGRRPVQELFTGALGRAYTYLYTPVLPQKDELELWLGFKLNGTPLKKEEEKAPPREETPTDAAQGRAGTEEPRHAASSEPVPTQETGSQEPVERRKKRRWKE